MKEQYISPQLSLLSFASKEDLASSDFDIDFDKLLGGGSGVSADPNIDIDVPVMQ